MTVVKSRQVEYADHVKCNNCSEEYLIRVGAEVCTKCLTEGCLADIEQEVMAYGDEVEWVDSDFDFH